MAPRDGSQSKRRSVVVAVLTVLLFFAEQSLLAAPPQTPFDAATSETLTIGGGAQWLLGGCVLIVSWGLFFAVVRGINVPRSQS